MQVILPKNCLSLTGMLRPDLGYYLRSTKKGKFIAQRSSHGAPRDGHWRFIVLCAELAHNGLYIRDVKVSSHEVNEALTEAGYYVAADHLKLPDYDARGILNLKTTFGL